MSAEIDSYVEIARQSAAELVEQGSRFLAEAATVRSEEEASRYLNQIRTREYRAHHHCWAWQLGTGKQREGRSADDGEPSGTAGRPIADQIRAAGVTNVMVVVTRYFGGTKLGTGGLVRAYAAVASEALATAGTITCYLTEQIGVNLPLDRYGALKRLVSSLDGSLIQEEFSDRATAIAVVRASRVIPFTLQLSDILQGRGSFIRLSDTAGDQPCHA